MTQAEMSVLAHMIADPIVDAIGGNNAIFSNEAANFTAHGNVTDVDVKRSHGVRHGQIFVPLNDGVIEGKWIALNPEEAKSEHVEAFAAMRKAVTDLDDQQAQMEEMLKMIAADEDGIRSWK